MQATSYPHLSANPAVRGGDPCISGTRITVADIVIMHFRMNQSVEEIAGLYDLALSAVHSALSYYYDHQQEVDGSIEEDEAFVAAFKCDHPSPLQEKLRAIKSG